MPWTARDADRHSQGLTAHQRTVWARVANSALRACMADGADQASCEGSAIRQANAAARRAPAKAASDALDGVVRKSWQGEVTFEAKADGPEGAFRATFAHFNQYDKDGDVTLPGAFTNGQQVRIARWGHNWADLPVGKGTIHTNGQRAWVDGQFFTETQAGRETYLTVKALGDLQEWSYGFAIEEHSFGDFEGREARFLRKLNVFEVSPVMIGAGNDTRTERIKSAILVGEADADAAADDLGLKVGRRLSAATVQRLRGVMEALATLLDERDADDAQVEDAVEALAAAQADGTGTDGEKGAAQAMPGTAQKDAPQEQQGPRGVDPERGSPPVDLQPLADATVERDAEAAQHAQGEGVTGPGGKNPDAAQVASGEAPPPDSDGQALSERVRGADVGRPNTPSSAEGEKAAPPPPDLGLLATRLLADLDTFNERARAAAALGADGGADAATVKAIAPNLLRRLHAGRTEMDNLLRRIEEADRLGLNPKALQAQFAELDRQLG